MTRTLAALLGTAIAASTLTAAQAQELNLYSSRHYDTDERLYSDFTEATGITINRIEGNADELIARMQAEGANSPADVFLTVDTVRLARAADLGLLQSVDSDVLERAHPRLPAGRRQPLVRASRSARGSSSTTADVPNPPQTYQDLAEPGIRGHGLHPLLHERLHPEHHRALIAHLGQEAVQDWAPAVVSNFARDPQGGDTDQLRGIVSGECDIAMSNTYYFARALRTATRADVRRRSTSRISAGSSPNQNDIGAHMNISGGGVAANAPNRENAIAFLEYLASDQAQDYFSAGNDEYPAVPGVGLAPSVASLGIFRPDVIDLSDIAANVDAAVEV
jgi:iron(III) transport system substrate-binding protein